jgi:tRNA (guanine37-N1)-methyltransferase
LIFGAISIFPKLFDGLTSYGITSQAFEKKICSLLRFDPRDYATDNYRKVDDKPFGGGPGVVMKVEPLEKALEAALEAFRKLQIVHPLRIYLSPQGKIVNQQMINELSREAGLIFVCGRYEGIDERFIEANIDIELSIGDFVVSGGELPAMLIMDAIIRHLPGVVQNSGSVIQDSFMNGLLDYPTFTVPREYRGKSVPSILLSGNHKQIELWRLQMSLWRTYCRRPDLLQHKKLNKIESRLLQEMIEKHESLE